MATFSDENWCLHKVYIDKNLNCTFLTQPLLGYRLRSCEFQSKLKQIASLSLDCHDFGWKISIEQNTMYFAIAGKAEEKFKCNLIHELVLSGACLRNYVASLQVFELIIIMKKNNLMLFRFQKLCNTLNHKFLKFFSADEWHGLPTFLQQESARKHLATLIRKYWCTDFFPLFCLATEISPHQLTLSLLGFVFRDRLNLSDRQPVPKSLRGARLRGQFWICVSSSVPPMLYGGYHSKVWPFPRADSCFWTA